MTSSTPTRVSSATFAAKRLLLCGRTFALDVVRPIPRLKKGEVQDFPVVLGTSRTPLYSSLSAKERMLERGKVQNLRVLCGVLNGVVLAENSVFSFWNEVGRCTRRKGYAVGREIKEGCLVPAIGGGICQLTNALHGLALDAGLEIVQRHPHTRSISGTEPVSGRDATVAWNYIDLKLRSSFDVLIECRLTSSNLIVTLRSRGARPTGGPKVLKPLPLKMAQSCATCGEHDCHHKAKVPAASSAGRWAALVDDWWPEFDRYLHSQDVASAYLMTPLHTGLLRGRPGWSGAGFSSTCHTSSVAVLHSVRLRRVASQGVARQLALQDRTEALAKAFQNRLAIDVEHLVIELNLLPYLWQMGVLGGRTFDVLVNRMPLGEIHKALDAAYAAHPERPLLSDFRANAALVAAEEEALSAARYLVTPHRQFCQADPRRVLLDWDMPAAQDIPMGNATAFPGPTVGRKGAYELREAMAGIDAELVPLGSQLEGPDFWKGVKTRSPDPSHWLAGVSLVVQPALIEDKPRRLLQALAAGRKVMATVACGLPPTPGLVLLPNADPVRLREAIESVMVG